MWHTDCTIGTLKVDVTIKITIIILTNIKKKNNKPGNYNKFMHENQRIMDKYIFL